MDHEKLVDVCKELFVTKKPAWEEDSFLLLQEEPPLDNSVAQYTGGDKRVSYDNYKSNIC